MTDRVVELAEGPARLSVRLEQLVIHREGQPEVTTPISEMAALLLSTPQVQFTQAVLASIAAAGGSVVLCDGKHLPAAMVLPMQTHFIQTERFAIQARLSEPRRKRVWQRIVQGKIRAQSQLLSELHGDDGGLGLMAARVRSGDPENFEAQASRKYWPRLFANSKFRRDREAPDQNRHLNYGYTVLRAMVARALCGAGLHPSFGLMHRNRYDAFSLASDFMEPFRAIVDRSVCLWIQDHDAMEPLNPESKAWLVGALQSRFFVDGEIRALSDILIRSSSRLAQVILGKAARLEFSELAVPCAAD